MTVVSRFVVFGNLYKLTSIYTISSPEYLHQKISPMAKNTKSRQKSAIIWIFPPSWPIFFGSTATASSYNKTLVPSKIICVNYKSFLSHLSYFLCFDRKLSFAKSGNFFDLSTHNSCDFSFCSHYSPRYVIESVPCL